MTINPPGVRNRNSCTLYNTKLPAIYGFQMIGFASASAQRQRSAPRAVDIYRTQTREHWWNCWQDLDSLVSYDSIMPKATELATRQAWKITNNYNSIEPSSFVSFVSSCRPPRLDCASLTRSISPASFLTFVAANCPCSSFPSIYTTLKSGYHT